MSSVIIPASKSLTVTNKFPNGNINDDTITVGHDGIYNYLSYLFFDISAVPPDSSVNYAELVLFKVDKFYDCNKVFGICQLNDYFSTYTTYDNQPKINCMLQKNFYPLTSKAAVTIPFTLFVKSWLKSSLLSTNIVLYGKSKNTLVSFGSSICTNTYLIPFIKVFFTEVKCQNTCPNSCHPSYPREIPTVRQIQVTGTVAPEGNYQAIVNLEVSRQSGYKDNYYVTDIYDNSQSQIPLHINKTYNLAVIPKENPGDTENVTFYGSYKL